MDEIRIEGLKIYAYHGVLESEKENGQDFYVNITFYLDTMKAGTKDSLSDTINYAEASEYVNEVFTADKYNLLERVAEKISVALLNKYPISSGVKVEIFKPNAPISVSFNNVSVCIERRWTDAYIAVGSNLGDSKKIIDDAFLMLNEDNHFRNPVSSSLISTKPYGYTDQPDFVNGMWKVETVYNPSSLLEKLHEIEHAFKRERLIHWGPRTLDLDIIYFGDSVIYKNDLIVPHADMINREFVLKPLCEIAPWKIHPVYHKSSKEMLNELNSR